jgi:membrane-associated phospholipid phosphatase
VRLWEAASLLVFLYTAVVALLPRGLSRRAMRLALAGSAAGLLLTLASIGLPHAPLADDWLLPPILLLASYWVSGLLFVAPAARQERALLALDRELRIVEIARRFPGPVATVLEVAYTGVYLLIPIAYVIHLFTSGSPDPVRFWSVILITDYICFGMLPWVQTRPPRVLESAAPWTIGFRRVNVSLLGAASIQVNTFPSGHAAEALAAALLVLDAAPPAVVLAMFTAALAVAAGAVFGRYHYAADAIAGWAVALAVWLALR